MPIPKAITGVNRRLLNPVVKLLAKRAPLMAVVVHRGRRSGRRYETPVLAFARAGTVTIALTYGSDVDWLKNVRASGGCRLIRRGREREAVGPRMLSPDEGRRRMPAPIRVALRFLDVDEFLELTEPSQRTATGDGS